MRRWRLWTWWKGVWGVVEVEGKGHEWVPLGAGCWAKKGGGSKSVRARAEERQNPLCKHHYLDLLPALQHGTQPFTKIHHQLEIDNKNAAANPNYQQWQIHLFVKLNTSINLHHINHNTRIGDCIHDFSHGLLGQTSSHSQAGLLGPEERSTLSPSTTLHWTF